MRSRSPLLKASSQLPSVFPAGVSGIFGGDTSAKTTVQTKRTIVLRQDARNHKPFTVPLTIVRQRQPLRRGPRPFTEACPRYPPRPNVRLCARLELDRDLCREV